MSFLLGKKKKSKKKRKTKNRKNRKRGKKNFDEAHLTGSSPPSPELDLPPILFIATAIVSCVSLEMAPRDIPPVQKRAMISAAGSTSSIEMAAFPGAATSSRQSRRTEGGELAKCCM